MLKPQAAGLPIVASDSALRSASIVRDGHNGFLCETSREAYAAAIARIEEPLTGQKYGRGSLRLGGPGKAGRWDDCADRYIRLYRQLLEDMADG